MTENNNIQYCNDLKGQFDETELKGEITVNELLQHSFDKHIGSFEIPSSLKTLFDIDEVNAIITWYLNWKLTYPINMQNTCVIKHLFGYYEGIKVIIAINLYKYLRNKDYDPDVVEKFKVNQ